MAQAPHRQDHDRLSRMVSLPRPQDEVWAQIGGFDRMADWHPMISAVDVAKIEGEVHRHLTTTDGEIFFEHLIETGLPIT